MSDKSRSMRLSALMGRLVAWWPRGHAAEASPGESGRRGFPLLWWEAAGYGGLLLTAAFMRLWDLGSRAMHHDESLHAFYSWELSKGLGFQHTPMMHGPFQFDANAAIFFLLGDGEVTARLLYALMGTALVALPFFLRSRLGRPGALLTATLLTFSPAMLYFSRFARNDILMAAWTLGIVISMWRFIDEGKNRYLYLSSGLLALALATKETSFMMIAILALFLMAFIAPRNWAEIRRRIDLREVSPPVALIRLASGARSALDRGFDLALVSRPTAFLILMATLSLPQWSAMVSVFQDSPLLSWSNLVLAAPEGSALIGAPSGGGLVIATLVVLILLGASMYVGAKWNWAVWWRAALIFYVVWVLLYTTFLTNPDGIGSGMWRSLGYWVVQQGEARGAQPWYYYFVITPVYEFLPLLFGIIAAVYYSRRNDAFGRFLALWIVATFVLYSVAGEKMPWLLVSVTLPLIIASGKLLGELIQSIQWHRLVHGGGLLVLPGVPVLFLVLWSLAFFDPESWDVVDVLVAEALVVVVLGIAALGSI